jgi:hypothetical protein
MEGFRHGDYEVRVAATGAMVILLAPAVVGTGDHYGHGQRHIARCPA